MAESHPKPSVSRLFAGNLLPAIDPLVETAPVVLPAVRFDLAEPMNLLQNFRIEQLLMKPRPIRLERPPLPKRPDCGSADADQEGRESKLIALIDRARKISKQDLNKVTKSISSIMDFDNEKATAAPEDESAPAPEAPPTQSCPTEPFVHPQFNSTERYSIEP